MSIEEVIGDGGNQRVSLRMAGTSSSNPNFEKFDGTANYTTWKTQMELFLITEDLWEYVERTPPLTDATACKRDSIARAKMLLMVKPHCLVHARKTKTAKECWEALRATFEDKGVNNRCRLLGRLVSQKLSNFESPRHYVTEIMSIAQQLGDIGKEVDDELLAALMLQGLGEQYMPLRMAIENSNTAVTVDYVKTKLLHIETTSSDNREQEMPSTSALVSSKKNFSSNRNGAKQRSVDRNHALLPC